MHRQVKRRRDAIHSVIAPAAFGLLAVGTALDVLAAGQPGALTWLAFWSLVAGIASGIWCMTWALLDWIFFAKFGDAGACGLDGFAIAMVVGLYALSALLRIASVDHAPPASAVALEISAAALLGMKAWIGRELAMWLDDRRR
jgi:uncharacterized membrane protein